MTIDEEAVVPGRMDEALDDCGSANASAHSAALPGAGAKRDAERAFWENIDVDRDADDAALAAAVRRRYDRRANSRSPRRTAIA